VPKFEFVGPDPVDHFRLGRIAPGDVHEFDEQPSGPWRAVKRRRPDPAEQDRSDATPEES